MPKSTLKRRKKKLLAQLVNSASVLKKQAEDAVGSERLRLIDAAKRAKDVREFVSALSEAARGAPTKVLPSDLRAFKECARPILDTWKRDGNARAAIQGLLDSGHGVTTTAMVGRPVALSTVTNTGSSISPPIRERNKPRRPSPPIQWSPTPWEFLRRHGVSDNEGDDARFREQMEAILTDFFARIVPEREARRSAAVSEQGEYDRAPTVATLVNLLVARVIWGSSRPSLEQLEEYSKDLYLRQRARRKRLRKRGSKRKRSD